MSVREGTQGIDQQWGDGCKYEIEGRGCGRGVRRHGGSTPARMEHDEQQGADSTWRIGKEAANRDINTKH